MAGFSERRPISRPGRPDLWLLLMALCLPQVGEAQIISPGKLTRAHSDLEGMTNCTNCHKLRVPGADPDRCLQCHTSLASRIEQGEGYHGLLEDQDCGACHKEHLGVDFALVRMNPDTFPHFNTGYRLEGNHGNVECRACHTAKHITDPDVLREFSEPESLEKTYLGLDPECRTCHTADDPHRSQFNDRDCSACHAPREWDSAPGFDHGSTSFPLEGRHQYATCGSCHISETTRSGEAVVRYSPVDASDCVSCHADPHAPRMSGLCSSCHSVDSWLSLNRAAVESAFDHAGTTFPLEGAHARIECRACHSPARSRWEGIELRFEGKLTELSFPPPSHETCASCHVDAHDGVFEGRGCESCHTSEAWAPPDYDRARHQMELRFALSGAHEVTPCSACHETGEGPSQRLEFRFPEADSCTICHGKDDPHGGEFGDRGCDLCHQTTVFAMETFDHELLERATWNGRCLTCHAPDGPHGRQFGARDCGECHGTEEYAIADFDHSGTRFPLEGAHRDVSCTACHLDEVDSGGRTMTRYSPLETDCTACHGGVV